ncbi:MAG: DUF4292 domain-containing protein [Bacteroidales bacterium]
MKNNRYFFCFFLVIFFVFSCGTPKKVSQVPSAPISFDTLLFRANDSYNQIFSLSGRYTIDVSTGREETSVVAQVRYLRDSAIWASVFIVPGMELFRVVLTPDSVKLIDRIHEAYLLGKIEQWTTLLPINLNYYMIVRLLIPHLKLISSEWCINCTGNMLTSNPNREGYNVEIASPNISKCVYDLNDKGQIRSFAYENNQEMIEVRYSSYKRVHAFSLPDRIKIITRGKSKMKIDISNVKVDVNIPIEIPFKAPKTYKKLAVHGSF